MGGQNWLLHVLSGADNRSRMVAPLARSNNNHIARIPLVSVLSINIVRVMSLQARAKLRAHPAA